LINNYLECNTMCGTSHLALSDALERGGGGGVVD